MNTIKLPMLNLKWFNLILAVLIISSCGSNDRPVYQGDEYYKKQEVPAELTKPENAGQLITPKPTDEVLPQFRDNKLETLITPKFDGVRVVSYAGNSWLEIDNDADKVWLWLLEFWQTEGVELAETRPLLGYMETEWSERLAADTGFFTSVFQSFSPDQKNKFRVRVEKFEQDKKTRLYITHSKIERIVQGEYAEDSIWVSRPSELEAERELIARMSLFAGVNKKASKQLVKNYRSYSSLVKIDRNNAITLTMAGSMDFVWRRAVRALDRMHMQNISEEKRNNVIHFVVGKITKEELHVEEDEVSKSSWIMQLFSDVDETNIALNKNRQYRLEFADVKGRIQIAVKDARDSQVSDEEGDVSGTALAEQLRNILAENLE